MAGTWRVLQMKAMSFRWYNWSASHFAAKLGVSAANAHIYYRFSALEADSAAIFNINCLVWSLALLIAWLRKVGVFVNN